MCQFVHEHLVQLRRRQFFEQPVRHDHGRMSETDGGRSVYSVGDAERDGTAGLVTPEGFAQHWVQAVEVDFYAALTQRADFEQAGSEADQSQSSQRRPAAKKIERPGTRQGDGGARSKCAARGRCGARSPDAAQQGQQRNRNHGGKPNREASARIAAAEHGN